MADFKSHSKIEKELIHHFRERLSHSESTDDAKKFFTYTIIELLGRVLGEGTDLRFEDIALDPSGSGYRTSARLTADPGFTRALKDSDLGAIISRFAESAQHRVRHLAGHPEKTKSKIRGRQP